MVTYIPINLTSEKTEYSKRFEEALDYVFRNTYGHINAHVIYNFKSPTDSFGEYEFLLFIDIPFGKTDDGRTNYCKWNGKFVNSIAIAVRRFDMPEVIDIDCDCLYTELGSFNYAEKIESERKDLQNYVYKNIPSIKHFDIAILYNISAPKCVKSFYENNIAFNRGIPLASAITYAVELLKNYYGSVNALLWDDSSKSATWDSFINIFVETSERHTKQGILTKRKVNSITRKNLSKNIKEANSVIGNQLCIIKGRPGTGKTNTLLCLMYNQVKAHDKGRSHHCRLLTYNNMLVTDLKQILKGIGEFNPTNASISTLHKFFFDIYKVSPVRKLNLDQKEIDKYFLLCLSRVAKFNALLESEFIESGLSDLKLLFRNLFDNGELELSDRKEFNAYRNRVLKETDDFDISLLEKVAIDYVIEKRNLFLSSYHKKRFIYGYNVILQQLYLMFHDMDTFMKQNSINNAYVIDEIRDSEEYRSRYQDLFSIFLQHAERRFQSEDLRIEDIVLDFHTQLDELDAETAIILSRKTEEENKEEFNSRLKRIKRKVNWSSVIFVDEGQDCQPYEKALLLELNGSDNTVVATGGSSQLIRTAKPNDWKLCLGQQLYTKDIELSRSSFRQKGNIIQFINAFSKQFNINSTISIPEEMKNKGRVIIDCRQFQDLYTLPLNTINGLYLGGKNYGCSNYENLLFLFPHNYTENEDSEDNDVFIDAFGYVDIRSASSERHLRDLNFPDNYHIIDGSVNDKRNLQIGQDSTRCILYESCRGIESWNVLCIDIDKFFIEKISSKDADEYAESNADLFITKEQFKTKYAALWCYMAMTRAMDTLYIKISNPYSSFSTSLIKIAEELGYVEILRDGNDENPLKESDMTESWVDGTGARYSSDWTTLLKGPNRKEVENMIINTDNYQLSEFWLREPITNSSGEIAYWCSFDNFENGCLLYLSKHIWKHLDNVNKESVWNIISKGKYRYIISDARNINTGEWIKDNDNKPIMIIRESQHYAHLDWNGHSYSSCRELDEKKEYCIEPGTISIKDRAFSDCKSLKIIAIPDSVEHVSNNAFYGCDSLQTIKIPDGTLDKFRRMLSDFRDKLVETGDNSSIVDLPF